MCVNSHPSPDGSFREALPGDGLPLRAARLLASLQIKGRECLHSAAPWTALLVISTMTALKKKVIKIVNNSNSKK